MTQNHPHPMRHVVRASILALAILAGLAGCGSDEAAAEGAQDGFVGTVVYEASAGGTNAQGVAMFRELGPSREMAAWGSGGRARFETTGGMMAGIIVARMADSALFSLDTVGRVAHPVLMESLNLEDLPPEDRGVMAHLLGPAEVEPTGEEGSYAGRPCRMYTVRKTLVMRAGATARACVAEDIHPRPSRYKFERADGAEQMSALPLQYGISQGLPLMLEVNEGGTIVTYTAVSVTPGEPADSLFSVPAGYTVQPPAEDP